jgi:tripartite-type tricarboxylate transporter receptor subunit TctC
MEELVTLRRRQFLHLAAGAATLPVLPCAASALEYPTRPVRLLVPFAPGGTTDLVARLMGQWLSEHLHQPFVVENRPGANGTIASELAVRAPADGYMLLMINIGMTIGASLFDHLNFDLARDVAPVASVFRVPDVMVIGSSIPAKTVSELIAYAKANPGKINLGSGGTASPSSVAGALFNLMAGVDLFHVPYRGEGPAVAGLIAGEVQAMFAPVPAVVPYIKDGALRALAVTSRKRVNVLPDVPVMADYVPGYEASTWQGIGAPRNTPVEIVDTLNKEVHAALDDRGINRRFADLGGEALPMTPAEFGKFIADETEKWAQVVHESHIKVE